MVNRRSFLKLVGIGATSLVVAPYLKPIPAPDPIQQFAGAIPITSEMLADASLGPELLLVRDGLNVHPNCRCAVIAYEVTDES